MSQNIVVLNKGQRIFKLRQGPNGEVRELHPGQSIETLDKAEAEQLLGYAREISDAANVVPANASRIKAMQAEIDRLKADNERLMQTAPAPVAEESPEEAEAGPEAETPSTDEAPARRRGKKR